MIDPKELVILYRAHTVYNNNSSVESVIKFLEPRIARSDLGNMDFELQCAESWWKSLPEDRRIILHSQYVQFLET